MVPSRIIKEDIGSKTCSNKSKGNVKYINILMLLSGIYIVDVPIFLIVGDFKFISER